MNSLTIPRARAAGERARDRRVTAGTRARAGAAALVRPPGRAGTPCRAAPADAPAASTAATSARSTIPPVATSGRPTSLRRSSSSSIDSRLAVVVATLRDGRPPRRPARRAHRRPRRAPHAPRRGERDRHPARACRSALQPARRVSGGEAAEGRRDDLDAARLDARRASSASRRRRTRGSPSCTPRAGRLGRELAGEGSERVRRRQATSSRRTALTPTARRSVRVATSPRRTRRGVEVAGGEDPSPPASETAARELGVERPPASGASTIATRPRCVSAPIARRAEHRAEERVPDRRLREPAHVEQRPTPGSPRAGWTRSTTCEQRIERHVLGERQREREPARLRRACAAYLVEHEPERRRRSPTCTARPATGHARERVTPPRASPRRSSRARRPACRAARRRPRRARQRHPRAPTARLMRRAPAGARPPRARPTCAAPRPPTITSERLGRRRSRELAVELRARSRASLR